MERLLSVRRARSRDARYAKSAAPDVPYNPELQRPLRRARSRDERYRRIPLWRALGAQFSPSQQLPPEPASLPPQKRQAAPPPQPAPPPQVKTKPKSPHRAARHERERELERERAHGSPQHANSHSHVHAPLDVVPEPQPAAELRRAFTPASNTTTSPLSPSRLHFSRTANRSKTIDSPEQQHHQYQRNQVAPQTPPRVSGEVPSAPTPPSIRALIPSPQSVPPQLPSALLGDSVGSTVTSHGAPPQAQAKTQKRRKQQSPAQSQGQTTVQGAAQKTDTVPISARMPDRPRSPTPTWNRTLAPSTQSTVGNGGGGGGGSSATPSESGGTKRWSGRGDGHTHAQALHAASRALQDRAGDRHARSTPYMSSDVKALCEALRGAINDPGRAEAVLSVLASRGVSEDQVPDLLSGGALDALAALLIQHRTSATVCAQAAWSAAALARAHPPLRELPICSVLVQPLVQALTAHGENAPVVECALRALHSALGSDASRTAFAAPGVEAAIQAMGRHADIAPVQALGAAVLAAAVRHHQCHAAATAGFALDALVTAMRGFTADPRVQRAACAAMRNLAAAAPTRAAADAAGRKGAVNAALEALAAHAPAAHTAPLADAAVTAAAAALRALISSAPDNAQRLANSADWPAILLGTLGARSGAPCVQCDLLAVLAAAAEALPSAVPTLVDAGALGAALAAMRRNVHSRAVLAAGARVARALLAHHPENPDAPQLALRNAGGVATLIDMLSCATVLSANEMNEPPNHQQQHNEIKEKQIKTAV